MVFWLKITCGLFLLNLLGKGRPLLPHFFLSIHHQNFKKLFQGPKEKRHTENSLGDNFWNRPQIADNLTKEKQIKRKEKKAKMGLNGYFYLFYK